MIIYTICKEYTDTPGARYINQSHFSGEDFRMSVLEPLYKKAKELSDTICIDLDGTYGYPPSFLEEAFGGLARKFPKEDVLERFEFKSEDQPSIIGLIKRIVSDEMRRSH